jgi:hypothetical protein
MKSEGQLRLGSDAISGPFASHAKHKPIRSKIPKTKSPNSKVIEGVKP